MAIEPAISLLPALLRTPGPPEYGPVRASDAAADSLFEILLGPLAETEVTDETRPQIQAQPPPLPEAQLEAQLNAPDEAGEESGVIEKFLFGEDGFTLTDLLDFVNPLQHIPGVNVIYRYYSGDEIGALPRLVGAVALGGPQGAIMALANATLQATTGKDIGGHALAFAEEGATMVMAAVEDWMTDDPVAFADATPTLAQPWIDPDQIAANQFTWAQSWIDPDQIAPHHVTNARPTFAPPLAPSLSPPWIDPDRVSSRSPALVSAPGGIPVMPWLMPNTPPPASGPHLKNLPVAASEAERRWRLNQAGMRYRQSGAAEIAQRGATGRRIDIAP